MQSDQRIEAFFVAGHAETVDGMLKVEHAWFAGLEVPQLPVTRTVFSVVVFDGQGPLPASINFDMFDPNGNSVDISNPGNINVPLPGPTRYVFIYESLTFELQLQGPHRLFVRLDGDLVDSASYELGVRVAG